MILSKDLRNELMINMVTGERFLRPLSKEELFEMVDARYSDDQAEEKLEKLLELGFNLEEVIEIAMVN